MRPVYLDYHATTPVDDRVRDIMAPYWSEFFGNPSNRHYEQGWKPEAAVENARKQVAALIHATPFEIIFTGGATESNNLALQGLAKANQTERRHIIMTPIEHKSVLETVKALEADGFEISYVRVNSEGLVDLQNLKSLLTPKTLCVSIMAANNELGTVQPLAEIGKLCKSAGVFFHTDAAQMAGYLEIDVEKMGIDLLSIAGHKMYAPKGVGALYIRRKNPRVQIVPLVFGGGQERGLRPGTLNVPAIVGLGKAAEIVQAERLVWAEKFATLRTRFWSQIQTSLPAKVQLNGPELGSNRLPHNLNFMIEGISASVLMTICREVSFSAGSACNSEENTPSHVLKAIGLSDDQARSSVRFSFGRLTTEADVDRAVLKLKEAVDAISREVGSTEVTATESERNSI